MVQIEGVVEEIIYANKDNGYVVCDINYEETLVTAVGYMPYINAGELVKLSGDWTVHKEYGKQFKVDFFERKLPETEDEMYKFLSSGAVKGVREATAKKIIDKFKEDTLRVLQEEPHRLSQIKGISANKADEIGQAFEKQSKMKDIVVFLQQFGVGTTAAVKVHKALGDNAVDEIKQNPYVLVKEVDRIGFIAADKIAMNLGFLNNNKERIKAGILHVLYLYSMEGHTYLPCEILWNECIKMMDIQHEEVEDAYADLQIQGSIVDCEYEGNKVCYLESLYYAEKGAAYKLTLLNSTENELDTDKITELIGSIENEVKITLENEQRNAVIEAVTNNITVITGGPGTGKTTIVNIIIRILDKMGLNVELAAPTGRAAKKISETTGKEAKTIHRLLEIGYTDELKELQFKKDEYNPIEADAVIIDEISMVDILLFNHLLKAVCADTKLILIGDKDQLPSVGPGKVLKDIIESNSFKVIKLTQIFRQASESLIVLNAHNINAGIEPVLNERDFYFIEKTNSNHVVESLTDLCIRRLPAKYQYNPMSDIQVLSPMKKTVIGIRNLNKILQESLNPPHQSKTEKILRQGIFREGDKVMQTKNNYDIDWYNIKTNEIGVGIFNGDIGYIEKINKSSGIITVIFDNEKKVEYNSQQIDELELAYALTIHKSQGSEFKAVVIPLFYGPPMLMTRNLLYTAVTRAIDIVVIVGSRKMIRRMIKNNKEIKRFSGFADMLIEE